VFPVGLLGMATSSAQALEVGFLILGPLGFGKGVVATRLPACLSKPFISNCPK